MTHTETLNLALEALHDAKQTVEHKQDKGQRDAAIRGLTEALAQPKQEPVAWSAYEYDGIHHKPVAWMDRDGNFSDNNDYKCYPIPLYTMTWPFPPATGAVPWTKQQEKAYQQKKQEQLPAAPF